MGDMSDLELVAQAMAPTEPRPTSHPAQANPAQTAKQKANGSNQAAPQHPSHPSQDPSLPRDTSQTSPDAAIDPASVPGLDPDLLASLSVEDRALLLPLISALQRADGVDGEEDADIGDILKQMDSAGDVADELEEKLDRLIQALGAEEQGLKEDLPQ